MRRLLHSVMLVSSFEPLTCEIHSDEGAVTHVLFETGSEELNLLERKMYVASGRFVIEEGKPPVVEYLISEVN